MTAARGPRDRRVDISSDIGIPSDSNEQLSMPNMSVVVKEETDRLIKELIYDIRSIVLADVNYESIDLVPQGENDFSEDVDFTYNEFNKIVESIQKKLNMGTRQTVEYNPAEFLKMFNIRYNNNTGQAEITLNLEFDGIGAEDISFRSIKIERSP
jgi:hypothetical protein